MCPCPLAHEQSFLLKSPPLTKIRIRFHTVMRLKLQGTTASGDVAKQSEEGENVPERLLSSTKIKCPNCRSIASPPCRRRWESTRSKRTPRCAAEAMLSPTLPSKATQSMAPG